MIRFAWLQSRTQTLATLALIAVLAVAAAMTGLQLSHLYDKLVAHCQSGCDLATSEFLSHDHFMDQALDIVARTAPALFGVFWGAPLLARELETGTYRFAWTQSVPRGRWLLTKLAIGAGITVTLAGLLTLTVTRWYGTLHGLSSSPYDVIDRRDIAPIGYALFAYALGVLVGALVRRTVPAMAVTLAGFVAVRVAVTWLRPRLLSPVHQALSLANAGPANRVQLGIASNDGSSMHLVAQGSGPTSSWTLSSHIVTSNGQAASPATLDAFVHQYCSTVGVGSDPTSGGVPDPHASGAAVDAGRACLQQAVHTFHLVVAYQPIGRYWTFQWFETGIFFALALGCALSAYWWVTRRSS